MPHNKLTLAMKIMIPKNIYTMTVIVIQIYSTDCTTTLNHQLLLIWNSSFLGLAFFLLKLKPPFFVTYSPIWVFRKGRSVHSSSTFSFWNATLQKFKDFSLIFNINIFRFETDAGLQVGIDFNNESKSFFSRSSFFSPLSGHPKPTKPIKLLLFYPFGRIRGPSKPSSQ